MAPPITPTSGRLSLGAQLMGAAYSMGIGVVGIVVPVISAFLLGGTVFYFYLLPLFGAIYGIRAITRGFVLGGVIGIVLNVVAGLVSLTASGLINPGG
jgi:uncharacterized membrane protein